MDPELLPPELCAQLVALYQSYWQAHGLTPGSVQEREAALQAVQQQANALVLTQHAKTDDQALEPEPCPCGATPKFKDTHARRLVCQVAEARLERRYYVCPGCGATQFPVDRAWELPDAGLLSPRAQATLQDLVAALPSREAQHWWVRFGGPWISPTTVWRASQRGGAALLDEAEAKASAQGTREGAANYLAALRGPGSRHKHLLEADGVQIRIEKGFHEVRVGLVGQLTPHGDRDRTRVSYVASTQEVETFRGRLVREALRRGVTRQSQVALISDGADWIAPLASRAYEQAVVIRDWYHAMGYVWQGAKAIYGEQRDQAQALAKELEALLWEGRVEPVRETLATAALLHPIESQESKEAYRQAQVYFENQGHAMNYPKYRQAGWPIGSGAVESACKTVVEARMKRAGMNWSWQGAEHLLLLRAAYMTKLAASPYPSI